MGDEVGGGDRDQRVGEPAAELAPREPRRRGGMPRTPMNQIADTAASEIARPTTNASSSARPSESPSPANASCSVRTRSLNSGPSLAPSNAVAADRGEQQRGRARDRDQARSRRPPAAAATSRPSARRPIGASRARSPNQTPNASPLRVHGLHAVEAHARRTGSRGRRASGWPAAAGRGRPPSTARRSRRRRGRRRRASGRAARDRAAAPAWRRGARRATSQPVARPIARHGLSSRKTSPSSSDTNGTPTQKPT